MVTLVLVTQAPFTRVRINFCTDKNLHVFTLLYTGPTELYEFWDQQVWDLLFRGPKLAQPITMENFVIDTIKFFTICVVQVTTVLSYR